MQTFGNTIFKTVSCKNHGVSGKQIGDWGGIKNNTEFAFRFSLTDCKENEIIKLYGEKYHI